MALMTSMRERMHVVLWALLVLFLLSMTVGGLVGGANIIDQLIYFAMVIIGLIGGDSGTIVTVLSAGIVVMLYFFLSFSNIYCTSN